MERQKFEDSFREAFKKAEVDPSVNVWTNIELDLERMESGKMKRRILFYKLVAAASIAFAMAVGGVGYYIMSTNDTGHGEMAKHGESTTLSGSERTQENLSSSDQSSPSLSTRTPGSSTDEIASSETDAPTAYNKSADTKPSSSSLRATQSTGSSHQDKTGDTYAGTKTDSGTLNSTTNNRTTDAVHKGDRSLELTAGGIAAASSVNKGTATKLSQASEASPEQEVASSSLAANGNADLAMQSGDAVAIVNRHANARPLPPLVRKRKIEPHFPKTEPDAFDVMLAREEWNEKEKKKSTQEKLWTSVGFSTGAYTGSNSSAVSAAALNAPDMGLQNYSASNSLSNEATASGVVYSVGLNVGTRLSNRWVLQGGLNYMQQSYDYTSDALMTSDFENYSTVNTADIVKMADGSSSARIVRSTPYNVDNNVKFLSFPVQAGYVLLNRSFAIQMNGGISTDLFLQGTASPEGEAVAGNLTADTEDSRYRPVNFSGLVGTEFSYRFADRYRVALTPGIRYPFNSIFKSEVGLEVRPLTFDVGLRFRYIFH